MILDIPVKSPRVLTFFTTTHTTLNILLSFPGEDAGTVPAVQVSTYPVYVEGTAVQPDTYRMPIEKPDVQGGYSPHVLTGIALAKATAVFRDFDQIKKPFRDCQTGACSQGRKCSRKELASGMCSLKKDNSMTSPVNGFSRIQKEGVEYGRSKGRSDEELSSETTNESGERIQEGHNDDQLKPSTMEEQAILTADAQLKAARPTLEGMGYILDLDKRARKALRPDKIIKIVKKDYFSQPLRLSSGGHVKDDGLWHAKDIGELTARSLE
ncbi:hypothetical protein MTO96_010511 [Rhipicephalus appendiculatus]